MTPQGGKKRPFPKTNKPARPCSIEQNPTLNLLMGIGFWGCQNVVIPVYAWYVAKGSQSRNAVPSACPPRGSRRPQVKPSTLARGPNPPETGGANQRYAMRGPSRCRQMQRHGQRHRHRRCSQFPQVNYSCLTGKHRAQVRTRAAARSPVGGRLATSRASPRRVASEAAQYAGSKAAANREFPPLPPLAHSNQM